ncbi:acyltransferase [Bacteroides acidifaciens]|jgi:maltose O-acetyltransferase|uniref:Acyltransferase n=1 Tax=Bacteroides acidifaciens TaxID=85831 RepID=A0A4S2AZB4_9BACE|nr:DapH/DapD/GlmU-related protein [Bacteroides acidifaciens]TGY06785.1 acyltransferase [Bacteroides acidifaciens]
MVIFFDFVKRLLLAIAYSLGLKKRPRTLTKEEQWRARGVVIGKNFHAYDSAIDYCFGFLVTIGDNVTLSGTTILAHDASAKKAIGYSKVGAVKIGDNVFLGYGCIVLPNVTIGNKVIVGAGTVVSKDIPDNVVVVGNPYRILSTYDDYIAKQKQRMETLPVYNISFEDKTRELQAKEKEEVQACGGGFDL